VKVNHKTEREVSVLDMEYIKRKTLTFQEVQT